MTDGRADDATLRQIAAADPGRSTWLTANAGSGKTRVLTDRVARLLLDGTRPERVLCLTYTKAAASEMQNRLLKRLGEWAMLPDTPLRAALADLGVADAVDLASARRLFALAWATLLEEGVADPSRHIVVLRSATVATPGVFRAFGWMSPP